MTRSVVSVAMGHLAVSSDREVVLGTLVGSCVALCLYDSRAIIAGMAHIMLPESDHKRNAPDPHSAKYADQAVENLFRMLTRKGAENKRIWAKMAGGANMFSHEGGAKMFNIGERNTEAIRGILKTKGIQLRSEDTGAGHGRRVEFFVHSGELVVESTKYGERRL